MEIIQKSINDIIPYENNPRKNEKAVESVKKSIKRFGFKNPIIVDSEGVIIAGHTRYKASLELGLETVPVIVADDLTEKQIKAYRLADNKTGELAEWDFNALEAELFDLSLSFDMSDFGFEIEKITDEGFGEEFTLPDDDKPAMRTITLTLCEEQYDIVMRAHDWIAENVETLHSFEGKNDKSNAIFEVVYQWAEQKRLV